MTSTERLVAERLRTYAGGLSVSEPDVLMAHDELRDRLEERSRRRTGTVVFAVAASAALIVAVGAVALRDQTSDPPTPPAAGVPASDPRTPEGSPPTVDGLTGIWRIGDSESSLLARFTADGSYALLTSDFDGNPLWGENPVYDDAGRLETPAGYGTYEIDGSSITFTNIGGHSCASRLVFGWLGGLPEEGRLDIVHTEANDSAVPMAEGSVLGLCYREAGVTESLTRVSPESRVGARISGDESGAIEIDLSLAHQLYGIWLQQGTGRLLMLKEQGTYELDDGGKLGIAPDDTGTFEVTETGQLALTSEQGSRGCAPGDSATWQQVRISSTSVSVGTVQDSCSDRGDLAGTWVRLA